MGSGVAGATLASTQTAMAITPHVREIRFNKGINH